MIPVNLMRLTFANCRSEKKKKKKKKKKRTQEGDEKEKKDTGLRSKTEGKTEEDNGRR